MPRQRDMNLNMKVVVGDIGNKQVLGKEIILHTIIEMYPDITVQTEDMMVETHHGVPIQVVENNSPPQIGRSLPDYPNGNGNGNNDGIDCLSLNGSDNDFRERMHHFKPEYDDN